MVKATCLLEDGINALGKLSSSGNSEMLCIESNWELLVVFLLCSTKSDCCHIIISSSGGLSENTSFCVLKLCVETGI